MKPSRPSQDEYLSVAEVEIQAVQPARSGFVLSGRGRDRADYRVEMQLEMPVDPQTRAVLSELLSQSQWRLWRRAPRPFRNDAPGRARKPVG